MSTEHGRKDFIGYEYKEIIADMKNASFWIDGYENFGWEQDLNAPEHMEMVDIQPQGKVIIRLKRNRKIINKMELTRLQNNFEACANELVKLEQSKTTIASVYALVIGFLGLIFMAGAIWAFTSQISHIVLGVLLTIPGAIGIILPYFVYRDVEKKQAKRVSSLIEEKYDEIYKICEKGNRLLH